MDERRMKNPRGGARLLCAARFSSLPRCPLLFSSELHRLVITEKEGPRGRDALLEKGANEGGKVISC